MKHNPLPAELFIYNRQRFAAKLPLGSMAIFHSNDVMPRSGDTFFPFRQNSDLFYLCGIEQEESILVLFPACMKQGFEEVLFIRRPSEKLLRYEGEQLTEHKARRTLPKHELWPTRHLIMLGLVKEVLKDRL